MTPPKAGSFAGLARELTSAFDRLATRRILLFGGKGGVGKTTLASLAAIHLARSRRVILFSTDPASNLGDLFAGSSFFVLRSSRPDVSPHPDAEHGERRTENEERRTDLQMRTLDADALWKTFLDEHLDSFVELGDRGTYLDRDEIRSLFRLSIPGIDELMGWLEIGSVAEANPDAIVVVDTAPTGHTLRLLSSSRHFEHLALALEEMQAKHRALVTQLTRRRASDALDAFLADFRDRFERHARMLSDAKATAFVPVFLAEPLVAAQTVRLASAVASIPVAIPFAILNQVAHGCDCDSCELRRSSEADSIRTVAMDVVRAPRACVPLGSLADLEAVLAGEDRRAGGTPAPHPRQPARVRIEPLPRLLFVAGKGGVGKTTVASSIALQLAARGRRVALISVDPAHSVRDLFPGNSPAENEERRTAARSAALRVETIDTRAKWRRLRDRLGDEIERAVSGLTAPNISISHDSEVLRELVEIAPPGADEIFAVMRLADLLADETVDVAVVDTAPTGHFLRLLELPRTAGEWAREMMRLLLRYKELVAPGSLAEELTQASRDLRRVDAALASPDAAAILVMRAEPLVAAETARLAEALGRRGLRVSATIVNALTPESGCSCERSLRTAEIAIATDVAGSPIFIDRLASPPVDRDSLRGLIPLE